MEREEGRTEGLSEGAGRVSRLNLLPIEQNRYDDLKKPPEYRRKTEA